MVEPLGTLIVTSTCDRLVSYDAEAEGMGEVG